MCGEGGAADLLCLHTCCFVCGLILCVCVVPAVAPLLPYLASTQAHSHLQLIPAPWLGWGGSQACREGQTDTGGIVQASRLTHTPWPPRQPTPTPNIINVVTHTAGVVTDGAGRGGQQQQDNTPLSRAGQAPQPPAPGPGAAMDGGAAYVAQLNAVCQFLRAEGFLEAEKQLLSELEQRYPSLSSRASSSNSSGEAADEDTKAR